MMEQARYWMWMKRKHDYMISSTHHVVNPNYSNGDLREEQAFAEDVVGCIWPPRCYSCSFCKREFKSAQALGGHMNVHRRDRAILKLSPNLDSPQLVHHFLSPQNSPRVLMTEHPVYSTEDLHMSTTRVSNILPPESRSFLVAKHGHFPVSDLKDDESETSSPNISYLKSSRCKNDEYEKADLSVNLSFHVCGSQANGSNIDEDLIPGCKKRRIDAPKSGIEDRCLVGVNPNHLEDLDLELRLGDRPKVK